jgi:hypothetical protein
MTRGERIEKKMRFCWHCGAELGVIAAINYDPWDTCGCEQCELAYRDAKCAGRRPVISGEGRLT